MHGIGLVSALEDHNPQLHPTVFVAPLAVVIGNVSIGAESSVWYGAVLRGDEEEIIVGERTNIQDGAIVHTTFGQGATIIGSRVTVGHRAVLHGCRIGDDALIGIGAVVLDGATVEPGAMVAAGAVVSPGKIVSAGTLWAGCPARYVRELKPVEAEFIRTNPAHYLSQAARHDDHFKASRAPGG
ncbi:MAG: gamma carbonic anhydrase family protein [Nitratireductor sp.]